MDGPRLRRSLLAAADWVAAGRDELNRLNVFPVPDGDTGTNLCLTLRAVAQAVRDVGDHASLPRITEATAQASVRGARGNSGLLLSQVLLGLREGRGDRLTATGTKLNVKPVMSICLEGTVEAVDRARGRAAARHRLLARLEAVLASGPRELRLVARYGPKQCLVSPITPVIAAHAGLGAWGVFYQLEDGTNG